MNIKAETKEDVLKLIEFVISMDGKKEKKNDPFARKKISKPKIRYFKLTFPD